MAVARMRAQYALPPVAAAGGGAPPPAPAAQETPGADPRASAACIALFVVALLISRFLPEHGPQVQAVEGLSAFGLFYVAAFVVERAMEPFVSLEPFTAATKERDRDAKLNEARAAVTKNDQDTALHEAAITQAQIDRWRASRAVIVLGIATVLGALVSGYFRLYFLVSVGVVYRPHDHWFHVFATALVIGGGTKPLHDLITRIQKGKDNASDPSEVGGTA